MEQLEEMRKWVNALSISEKRQVTLLGKQRSGSNPSLHLELFQWLNNNPEGTAPAADAPFLVNLSTMIARLKELILDSLRLQHKDRGIDASLRSALDQVAQLQEKKLYTQAQRIAKRSKRLATEHCRYLDALQLLEWENRLLRALQPTPSEDDVDGMIAEEAALMARLHTLQDLRRRHERLLAMVRHYAVPRSLAPHDSLLQLADVPAVRDWNQHHGFLERAFGCNILAIHHLMQRRPRAAIALYASLLSEWRDHPDWVADQAPLLLTICNYFQTALFYSNLDWNESRRYLDLVPDFNVLAPEVARDFQRMLFHNRLTPTLNLGKLDTVAAIIPEIEAWIKENAAHLTESQVLPFLHNFAISEFFIGNFQAAFRQTQQILNLGNRKVRRDIREFALVLQAVLQFELGDQQLHEYLNRSGKRYFEGHSREMEFEKSVLGCLVRVGKHSSQADQIQEWRRLEVELAGLAEQLPGTVPLLGLTEMQLWVQGKLSGKGITATFLEAIAVNLQGLENSLD